MSKKLERNDPCWCGSGKKYKNCHMRFDEKIHGFELEGHIVPGHDIIKTPEQIEGIRESGKVNIAVLDYVAENIRAGIRRSRPVPPWPALGRSRRCTGAARPRCFVILKREAHALSILALR